MCGYDEVRLPLLCHSHYIQFMTPCTGATSFITSAAQHLPPTDVWCILYPSLKHFLNAEVAIIDERSLLTVMKLPVSSLCCQYNLVHV
jgi:hypothetical protein